MQARGHPGGVRVPEQDVERRRLASEQVVVDPVIPDQVVRPQPGEHLGQRPAVQVAPRAGRGRGQPRGPLVDHCSGQARSRLVHHGDHEGERGEPVLLAGVRQVRGDHRRDDAAGAGAHERGLLAPGDLRGRLHGVEYGLPVGVEVPLCVPGVRVAPGDHEHLQAAADQILGQAPPGREVHHVELVDRRRHDHHRHLPDRCRDRAVLDQLEHRGPQDHRPGRDGQVDPHLERVRRDHRRHPRPGRHVREEMPQPRDGAATAGVDGGLQRCRVQQRVVARGQRVNEIGDDEADAFGVGPVQSGLGYHALGGLRGGQVRLHRPAQQRVARPSRVGEAAVAPGRLHLRGADGDAGQLASQPAPPPGHQPGPVGQRRGQAQAGAARVHAALHADGRVGEQQVQGRRHRVRG